MAENGASTHPGGATARPPEGRAPVAILGVEVASLDEDEAVALLDAAVAERRATRVAFANANLLNFAAHDADLRRALARFTVLNDGIGVDIARRVLAGGPFAANLNGTDFVPHYLETRRHALRIYLFGATEETVRRARAILSARYPRHDFVGHQHGFLAPETWPDAASAIARTRADLLVVALGNPRQEMWIDAHHAATGATVAMGVGALFDFVAGNVRRAPPIARRLRVEWIYRLALEPRRLARRYLIGNGAFLWRVARQRLGGRS